ncbi:MAG: hypothetical protein ACKVPY_11520 [Paracoccaceae bacterium]
MPPAPIRQDDAAQHAGGDALARWRAQETAPLPADTSDQALAMVEGAAERAVPVALPSGWWILPVVALSGALWALFVLAVFG